MSSTSIELHVGFTRLIPSSPVRANLRADETTSFPHETKPFAGSRRRTFPVRGDSSKHQPLNPSFSLHRGA